MSHDCTTLRHVRITAATMAIPGGRAVVRGVEEKVQPCAAPLFTEAERATGTCRFCAKGWEAEGNRFATPAEIDAYTRNRAPAAAH